MTSVADVRKEQTDMSCKGEHDTHCACIVKVMYTENASQLPTICHKFEHSQTVTSSRAIQPMRKPFLLPNIDMYAFLVININIFGNILLLFISTK